jgi:phytoene dehydrogenase-like protein
MGENRGITRRQFIRNAAATAAGWALSSGCDSMPALLNPSRRKITGRIVGASDALGHRLLAGEFPPPRRSEKIKVVVVGGGISALAAAWKLKKSGVDDFTILEMENAVGGNARHGEDAVSDYPWGAHYLPPPDKSQRALCEFLEEAGVLRGWSAGGEPQFEEKYLCFAPQERMFYNGRWQDDLWPPLGARANDLREYQEMKALFQKFKKARGNDGRKAFSIPIDLSSRDPAFLKFDRLSMADFMDRQGWRSPLLRWYVEYACRDDYGASLENTSAWAGIHYWASRKESFEKSEDVVLTWPEGNGFLVKTFAASLPGKIRTNSLVFDVDVGGTGATVHYFDNAIGESVALRADAVIMACPQFVAGRLLRSWKKNPPSRLAEFTYSPWVVANLWVEGEPESRGAPLAWDNVIMKSASLGYVVATHQRLGQPPPKSVWTYYQPFPEGDPADRRKWILERSWDDWKTLVLDDLRRCHPDIEDRVTRLDVMRWGHAMIRPVPGFIWGKAREESKAAVGPIVFAHSDLSGISIFEEAFHQGIRAAGQTLAQIR